MTTLKQTPPGPDWWLYTGNTSEVTFRSLTAGYWSGRTFDAVIVAPNTRTVVPAVSVSGDDIVTVTDGDDVAVLSGKDARYELRETTTGRPEVVFAGKVKTTHANGPPSTQVIEVTAGQNIVTVEVAPWPPGWLVAVDGGTPGGTGASLLDGGGP